MNERTDWSIGARVVMMQMNMRIHKSLKRAPWEALTGMKPRIGFNIPQDKQAAKAIISEAQLARCMSGLSW